uniref:Uncharacterized protein n=1 Tax=Sphaerodactylus townsendi TaxID=933632 RepID=A0ACB8FRD7_9SAUR
MMLRPSGGGGIANVLRLSQPEIENINGTPYVPIVAADPIYSMGLMLDGISVNCYSFPITPLGAPSNLLPSQEAWPGKRTGAERGGGCRQKGPDAEEVDNGRWVQMRRQCEVASASSFQQQKLWCQAHSTPIW